MSDTVVLSAMSKDQLIKLVAHWQAKADAAERRLQEAGAAIEALQNLTPEVIEAGCRGMYGKHWDGPAEKMPGEEMKEVWRGYVRKALPPAVTAALSRPSQGGQP